MGLVLRKHALKPGGELGELRPVRAISSASSLTTRSSLAGWQHDSAEAHAAFQNASLASFAAPPLAQAAPQLLLPAAAMPAAPPKAASTSSVHAAERSAAASKAGSDSGSTACSLFLAMVARLVVVNSI